ncbi:hypothetical protein Pmani_025660, partial [Petrolisthes manimaculis]
EQSIRHALVMSVVQSDGELAAVLELYRRQGGEWGGIALHYAELYHSMVKTRKLNDFILSVVKSIFQDMVSMDTLIMKIMNFAQKLVNADRASLFLVDNKNRQLYARIFDMGSEFDEDSPHNPSKKSGLPSGRVSQVSWLRTARYSTYPTRTRTPASTAPSTNSQATSPSLSCVCPSL